MYYLRKNSELVGLHKTIEKALAQAKKIEKMLPDSIWSIEEYESGQVIREGCYAVISNPVR